MTNIRAILYWLYLKIFQGTIEKLTQEIRGTLKQEQGLGYSSGYFSGFEEGQVVAKKLAAWRDSIRMVKCGDADAQGNPCRFEIGVCLFHERARKSREERSFARGRHAAGH